MFRDIELYNKIMTNHREHTDSSRQNIDISVRVLNPINWPLNATPTACTLPPSVEESFRQFCDFYVTKYCNNNGRRRVLQLYPALGTAVVKAIFYRIDKGTLHDAYPEVLVDSQQVLDKYMDL